MEDFTAEQKLQFDDYMKKSKALYPSLPVDILKQVVETYVWKPKVIDDLCAEHRENPEKFILTESK